MEELYAKIKTELKARPKELTSLEQWLFVVVNTAKSIIDNTGKDRLDMVKKLVDCDSTSQIQAEKHLGTQRRIGTMEVNFYEKKTFPLL